MGGRARDVSELQVTINFHHYDSHHHHIHCHLPHHRHSHLRDSHCGSSPHRHYVVSGDKAERPCVTSEPDMRKTLGHLTDEVSAEMMAEMYFELGPQ